MRKNILTVIILAMCLINIVLSAVLIFVMVPPANKSMKLIDKVAQIIDLELESPDNAIANLAVSDIGTYLVEERLTCRLAKSDDEDHYAVLYLSLSLNKTHEDYPLLEPYVSQYENDMKEIVTDEFAKYTIDEVMVMKDRIKDQVLTRIQELFQSDFIINVSFGNILYD
ncbi:MAG: flagellar basal body-associated protein FliL [Clostridiales bacterium]|jgi:flagellar basal body-associated protein FliL|nr:flagellar basal body-associated protein FliL [Clostridiales bacterium]